MLPFEMTSQIALKGSAMLGNAVFRNSFAKVLKESSYMKHVLDPLVDGLHQGIGGTAGLAGVMAMSKEKEENMFVAGALLAAFHAVPALGKATKEMWFSESPTARLLWADIERSVAAGIDLRSSVPKLMDAVASNKLMRKTGGSEVAKSIAQTFRTSPHIPHVNAFRGPYSRMPETYRRLFNRWVYERGVPHRKFDEVMFNALDKLKGPKMKLAWSRHMDKPFSNLERETLGLTEKEFSTVQNHARAARQILQAQHIEAHDLKLLGDQAYVDHMHDYLARLYGKYTPGHPLHELSKRLQADAAKLTKESYDPKAVQTFKNNLDRFKERKDLPAAVRGELGEIKNAFYKTWR